MTRNHLREKDLRVTQDHMDSEGDGAIAVSHAQLVTSSRHAVHPDAEQVSEAVRQAVPHAAIYLLLLWPTVFNSTHG